MGRVSLRAAERDPPAHTSSLDFCLLKRERINARCFKPPHLQGSETTSVFYVSQVQAPLGGCPSRSVHTFPPNGGGVG